MYDVNGKSFESFTEACASAKRSNMDVFEVRPDGERIRRWTPPALKKSRVRHVIKNADGSTTEFGKVRR